MAIDIIGSYRKWSLLTTPLIILGGIVSTVIVCDFLFRNTVILESNLVLLASTSESKVFYLKMKGDYHMYMAKFKVGDERKEAAEDTMNSYKAAQIPTHPIRLRLALSFSVFYYEILYSSEKACSMAKQTREVPNAQCVGNPSL